MVDCWIWLLCSTLAGSMFVFRMEVSTQAEFRLRHLIVDICFEHQMLRHVISKLKCLCFKAFFCHSLPKYFPQHSLRQLEHYTVDVYLITRAISNAVDGNTNFWGSPPKACPKQSKWSNTASTGEGGCPNMIFLLAHQRKALKILSV